MIILVGVGGIIGGNSAVGGLYLVLVLGSGEGWGKRRGGVVKGNVAD